MTNEEKIKELLDMYNRMAEHSDFRLHSFEVYRSDLTKDEIVRVKYTFKKDGVSEYVEKTYLVFDGQAKNLNQLLPDMKEQQEFVSQYEKVKFDCGGIIFN